MWAISYRKCFWDFAGVGATLGPHGLIPDERLRWIIDSTIVRTPIIQVVNLVLSAAVIVVEYPCLPLRSSRSKLYRSFTARIGLHLVSTAFALLLYQTIVGGFFHLVTSIIYLVASS
ncbi:hypothetical protein JCM3766R1_000051, partial [Sporobolomyces carnicolor]